jgi:hypothetical protein
LLKQEGIRVTKACHYIERYTPQARCQNTRSDAMSFYSSSPGSSSTSRGHHELRFYPKYHLDFMVNILPVPQIESYGAPVTIRRTEISMFGAERLNQDDVLNDILRKIKAPPIEIRENHIYLEKDKLPSQTLFLSIERIAEHIVVASTNWR